MDKVRPFSVLCLVSQEDTHCGGENAHLLTDTHALTIETGVRISFT